MTLQFKPAIKTESKLRMAIAGPSGSGKTYTSLLIAKRLANGGPVAVIDTERGSASKYSDIVGFDVLELESFAPQRYVEAIHAAEAAGYPVLIIDSLSHAWSGKDGALELLDKAASRMQSSNSYVAWREVTPHHNALVDAMLGSNLHLIATMRSKQEYVQEKDEKTGKTIIRKIGLAPIQRDGMEYEFDVFAEMDHANRFIVSKSRCPALHEAVIAKPDAKVAETRLGWLAGAPVEPKAVAPEQPVQNGKASDEEEPPAPEKWKRLQTVGARYGVEIPDLHKDATGDEIDELGRRYKRVIEQAKDKHQAAPA